MGTAFLTTIECAAPLLHKESLLNLELYRDLAKSRSEQWSEISSPTIITQCFTGKPARSLPNEWANYMHDIEAQLPNCFNGMPGGRVLQGIAVKENRADMMYMWAGQEYNRCR